MLEKALLKDVPLDARQKVKKCLSKDMQWVIRYKIRSEEGPVYSQDLSNNFKGFKINWNEQVMTQARCFGRASSKVIWVA